jgi:hypothetical protein
MTAYDYDTQTYVDGDDGARLCIEQCLTELRSLARPDYCAMVGCTDPDRAMANMRRHLRAAQEELSCAV